MTHAVDHAIHVTPPDGGPDVTGFRLYRARILDCGEQFLKVNPPAARDAWTDDGVVGCSHFEMTDDGRPHVERAVGGCYTAGIDAHSSRGWVVRQNTFTGIYCAGEGLAEHAIHFWVGSRDTLVERNVIADHNLQMVPLSYFVDGAGGDAHLTDLAVMAIDEGVVEAEAGLDLDGEPRGASPDLGADER